MNRHEASLISCMTMFLLLSLRTMVFSAEIPSLLPGDPAPPFVLQSTEGLRKYDGTNSHFNLQPPIVFQAFSENSGFLQRHIDNPRSIEALIHLSPENTHYVFMFYDSSRECAANLESKFLDALNVYYRKMTHSDPFTSSNAGSTRWSESEFIKQWMKRLHFITFPISQFGNWIPRLLAQWYCSGHGCGLDQLVIESEKGEILKVIKRLDARYDWLPSTESLSKFGRLNIVYIGEACNTDISVNVSGQLALVSMEEECSFFTKVFNSQKNGALGVVVYNKANTTLQDMNCFKEECHTKLSIPATMIPYEAGVYITRTEEKLFARFQTTPSDSFFFGIDGQGKLQETGLFLFPSMIFLAYQAQWFNYKTEMLHDLIGSAKVINIFKNTDISGKGADTTVEMPPLNELQQYEHVELDMSLLCPGQMDETCAPWDRVVHVFASCGQNELRGQELGRWITAFKRRIGRWLTPIKPLIPLLSSGQADSTTNCTFTVRTASWAKPWIVTLNIRLAGKIQANPKFLTADHEQIYNLVPFKIEPLFRGGRFDKNYNTKYRPITFNPPSNCARVELVAVITGHGSDNNKCAEFCVTSHHFVVNSHHTNTRVFKNAGTAMGCAERVGEGVVPNEYGTWLFGRDGWCPGQDVVPWVVDVTAQVEMDKNNTITYYGWFAGTDPNPSKDAGEIIMYSYLVYYKKSELASTIFE